MAKNSSFGHLLTPLQLPPSRETQICFKCGMFISGQFEEFSFQKATTFTAPKRKLYCLYYAYMSGQNSARTAGTLKLLCTKTVSFLFLKQVTTMLGDNMLFPLGPMHLEISPVILDSTLLLADMSKYFM